MHFRLLGPLEVEAERGEIGLGGPRQRLVLALLLLQANDVVSVDQLIDDIWGEEPPAAARSALYAYISRLRKTLGRDRLLGRPTGYSLRAADDEIDARRFEAALRHARRLLAPDPAAATMVLDEALGLWRGSALADLADEPSLQGEIARLEELRLSAIETRVGARLAIGRHAELIAELEDLLLEHPMRERLWVDLMLALYRSGRQAEALQSYLRARRMLADQLGVDPSPELQRLQQQILRQDPMLELAGGVVRGYRLLERIGEGAFGTVYRALQPELGREVAVKMIHERLANDADFIRRFEQEAQLVAQLEHPHIVPLYDYWREPGSAYLVMRYLRGGNLKERIAAARAMSADEAAGIVDQVALALAAAHRQGVVHRDVRPPNILFDDEGNAYLSDFGIAKQAASVEPAELASSDLAHYLSPEEIEGQPVTPATDVYSLGLVLFEVLAGRHPFADIASERVIECHLRGRLPSLSALRPDLPADIERVIERATARRPASRYTDARAFATAFRSAVKGAADTPAAVDEVRSPYKGLRPFSEADAGDFFGREALTARLLARLAEPSPEGRFLAVVGPSGSGKSSVVKAGLIPALRAGALLGSERWFVVDMHPGAQPFHELADALLRVAESRTADLLDELERDAEGLLRAVERLLPAEGELLLVIDQFEELFTLTPSEDRRLALLDAISAAVRHPASRVRVLMTLRADFFDRPLLYRVFGDLLARRSEAVAPLSADELARAVTAPAERVGLRLEPALTAQILSDAGHAPGVLPLLQYALSELFEHRHESTLTLGAYQEIGGVSGALARRAEQIVGRLDRGGKETVRQLFLRLVTISGDGVADVRRRVLLSELSGLELDAGTAQRVLDVFGRHRLLSFDRDPITRSPTVEVAHEALLREWGRLRGWIESAWEDVKLHRRLASAVADWENAGRDASFLLRGSRLDQFEGWARTSGMALTEAERGYLAESRAAQRAEQAEEEARQAREAALEHRSLVRLRALLAVFVIAAILASGLAFAALEQEQRARQQTLLASARELAAAAVANLELDPELSMLLALEAVEVTAANGGAVLPETEEALHRALLASRIVDTLSDVGTAVDWGTTGLLAFAGGWETGAVELRDAVSRETTGRWQAHESAINDIEFSTDGSLLATAADDGSVRLWKTSGGGLVRALEGPAGRVWGISFSADDRLLAAQWWDGTASVVLVWDVGKGEVVRTVAGLERDQAGRQTTYAASGTALSGDGSLLAISLTSRPSLELHDVHGGQLIARLPDEPFLFNVNGVAWQRGASLVASINQEATVSLWDAASGELHDTLFGHTAAVNGGDWSADGSRLVTASVDGTARVWEVTPAGGRLLLTLAGHGTGLVDAGFAPDGNQVVTLDTRGTAKIWDVGATGDAEWMNLPAEPRWFGAVAFTPDGGLLLGSGAEGTLSVFDAANGKKVRTLSAHGQVAGPGWGPRVNGGVASVGVSPDGRLVATGGRDNLVRVWSLPEGDEIYTFSGHDADAENWIEAVRFSPDGTLLASGSMDGTVRILEAATGREVQRLAHDGAVLAVRFLADGRTLVSGSWDGNMRVWDLDASTASLVIPVGEQINGLDVNPEETRVAAVTFQGTAAVWDVRTGERLLTLAGHSGPIKAVAYNPDGSLLATGSEDGEIRLWDAESGVTRGILRGHELPVGGVAFSPDGSRLASIGIGGGTIRVWAVAVDDLVMLARRELTRGLSDEECRQYLHVDACPARWLP